MRRKSLRQREPNGKPKRASRAGQQHAEPSPTEVKRLRMAALMGMRDPIWGSVLGYLHLSGKVNDAQFFAGDRWTMLARRYHSLMQAPRDPRSTLLTRVRASSRLTHERIEDGDVRADYESALVAVRSSGARGAARLRVLVSVCELDLLPVSQEQVDDVVQALETLKNHWQGR